MIPIETDQVEKGTNRLIYDLQIQENVVKLLTLFLNQVQEVEIANFSTMNERGIDDAIGFQLDLIGKIVGLERKGLDDEDYRQALLLKIGINTADGTPNTMINLIKQYSGSTDVEMREGRVAFGNIIVNGAGIYDSGLISLIDDIKPAATLWVVHSDYNENAFRPAYETSLGASENFQTTDDGLIYEDFQTTSNGVDYETFTIQVGGVTYYPNSLGNETLYYEEYETFQTTDDGVNFEDFQVTANGVDYEDFQVSVTPPDGLTPLTWEIDEDSVAIE